MFNVTECDKRVYEDCETTLSLCGLREGLTRTSPLLEEEFRSSGFSWRQLQTDQNCEIRTIAGCCTHLHKLHRVIKNVRMLVVCPRCPPHGVPKMHKLAPGLGSPREFTTARLV